MYFYKKVEIDIFFEYSDFGQGESTLSIADEINKAVYKNNIAM